MRVRVLCLAVAAARGETPAVPTGPHVGGGADGPAAACDAAAAADCPSEVASVPLSWNGEPLVLQFDVAASSCAQLSAAAAAFMERHGVAPDNARCADAVRHGWYLPDHCPVNAIADSMRRARHRRCAGGGGGSALAAACAAGTNAERAETRPRDLPRPTTTVRSKYELVFRANALGATSHAVEVGVWRGDFARHNLLHWAGAVAGEYVMVDAWAHRGNDTAPDGALSRDKNDIARAPHDEAKLFAEDATAAWRPPHARTVVARTLQLHSAAAATTFPDGYFDWIYIDAGHEFRAAPKPTRQTGQTHSIGSFQRRFRNVLEDLRSWWPKLRSGGLFSGDDFGDADDVFGPGWTTVQGVKSAVARFAETVGVPFFLTYAETYAARDCHVYTHPTRPWTRVVPPLSSPADPAERPAAPEAAPPHHLPRNWYMIKP